MAEGIARQRYPELATYASAGTMAVRGATPTDSANIAASEIGADIADLHGLALTRATDPLPDRIYVMTNRHLAKVRSALPGLADRVELLDPDREIGDPYGSDIDVYRRTRDQLANAIERRAAEWGAPQS